MNSRKVMGLAAFLAICAISYSESNFSLDDVLERAKTSNPSIKHNKCQQKQEESKKRELGNI